MYKTALLHLKGATIRKGDIKQHYIV